MKNGDSTLTKQQIETFFEEGFLIIPDCFNPVEVEALSNKANALRAEAETLAQSSSGMVMNRGARFVIEKTEDTVLIKRIMGAGVAEPDLLNISRQDKLLLPVSQLLGSKEADHLINQIHYKLPHDGVEFPWHQDVHNRLNYDESWKNINGKGSFVQSFIAIDPMNAENGAIFIIPHSTKYGEIPREIFQERIAAILTLEQTIPILLNPGDVVLMHPYLIHGSFPNESEESRIILINGFSYPGANTEKYLGAERISLDEELFGECNDKNTDFSTENTVKASTMSQEYSRESKYIPEDASTSNRNNSIISNQISQEVKTARSDDCSSDESESRKETKTSDDHNNALSHHSASINTDDKAVSNNNEHEQTNQEAIAEGSTSLSALALKEIYAQFSEYPEWLKEQKLNSTPVQASIESVEQRASIYDKHSIVQDFFIKMLSLKSATNSADTLEDKINEKAEIFEISSAELVDTNLVFKELTINGLILPIDASGFAEAINFNGLNEEIGAY